MKQTLQKKNGSIQVTQRGTPSNQKPREVTVIKHCHPNPPRPVTADLPKVRYQSKEPEEDNFSHLHPVFKFVDNFLSHSTIVHNSKPSTVANSHAVSTKKPPVKTVKKCGCASDKSIDYSGSNASNTKPFVTKKNCIPLSRYKQTVTDDKDDKVRTNITNINNNSIIRVSMKGDNLKSKNENDPSVTKKVELQENNPFKELGSDDYVERLKKEIKHTKEQMLKKETRQNREQKGKKETKQNKERTLINEIKQNTEIPYSLTKPFAQNSLTHLETKISDDAYVQKLKDEVKCSKSKDIEDARNLINQLQNEILNYRLQAKMKYSCSYPGAESKEKNLPIGDPLAPPPSRESNAFERKFGESLEDDIHRSVTPSDSPREESTGFKPCETIWQAKGSFPSSTETTLVYPVTTPEINFEEKLREANSLIEKIKEALKDIGEGINKMPERKKTPTEPENTSAENTGAGNTGAETSKSCPEKCQLLACSFHGQCNVTHSNEEKRKKGDEATENKDNTEQVESEKLNESENQEIIGVVEEAKETASAPVIEEEQDDQKKDEEEGVEENTIIAIKPVAENIQDYDELPDDLMESMPLLQPKLNTISEISETEVVIDKNVELKGKEDSAEKVGKTETGTSPIDFAEIEECNMNPVPFEEKIKEIRIETKTSTDTTCIYTAANMLNSLDSTSFTEVLSTKEHKSAVELRTCDYLREKSNKNSTQKVCSTAAKLSIQVMPPVNIPSGFVIQRTLHLCIKPTGSVSNELLHNANIGYREIKKDYSKSISDNGMFDREKSRRKCPEDCKNPNEDYCKVELPVKQHANSEISVLDADTLLVYRSFQILENETTDNSQSSLATHTHNVARGIQNTLSKGEKRTDVPLEQDEGGMLHPDDLPVPPGSNSSIFKTDRNPWEIGFYKTRSTQCSEELIAMACDVKIQSTCLDNSKTKEEAQKTKEKTTKPGSDSIPKEDDTMTCDVKIQSTCLDNSKTKEEEVQKTKEKTTKPGLDSIPKEDGKWSLEEVQKVGSVKSDIYRSISEELDSLSIEEVLRPEPGLYKDDELDKAVIGLGDEEDSSEDSDEEEENEPVLLKNTASREKLDAVEKPIPTEKPVTIEQPVTLDDTVTSRKPAITEKPASRDNSVKKYHPIFASAEQIESLISDATGTIDELSTSNMEATLSKSSSGKTEEEILHVLQETGVNLKETTVDRPVRDENKEVNHNLGEASNRSDVSLDAKVKKDEESEKRKGRILHNLSSSSSSSSKYSSHIHGSPSSHSDEYSQGFDKRRKIGVKRSYDSDERIIKSELLEDGAHRRSSPIPVLNQIPAVEHKDRKKKASDDKVDVEVQVSKNKHASNKAQKVDENIQVSLGSSSSESRESSSESLYVNRGNPTVAHFIEGLTGTSEYQIDKLRSTHSFPKNEASGLSRTILRPIREQRSNSGSKSPRYKRSMEDEKPRSSTYDSKQASNDNVINSLDTDKQSDDSSDKAKPTHHKKNQQVTRKLSERGDKPRTEKIVMRVTEERSNAGDGDDDAFKNISKNQSPFYRRLFGRAADRSSKTPTQILHTNRNPIDDSWSEGEIDFKSTYRVGGVNPYKYVLNDNPRKYRRNDKKKVVIDGDKIVKKYPTDIICKEAYDRSRWIWRERMEYNEWVKFYLKKFSATSFDDSSSSTLPDKK